MRSIGPYPPQSLAEPPLKIKTRLVQAEQEPLREYRARDMHQIRLRAEITIHILAQAQAAQNAVAHLVERQQGSRGRPRRASTHEHKQILCAHDAILPGRQRPTAAPRSGE